MANNSHRKRGGTFHLDDDTNEESDHDVQFVTPYYDESNMPAPLDLSKLCLDGEDDSEDGDLDSSEQDRAIETRGRSRSRSVHENDLGAPGYLPTSESLGGNSSSGDSQSGNNSQNSTNNRKGNNPPSNTNSGNEDKSGRKGGPLQHREVQALKKVSILRHVSIILVGCCVLICPLVFPTRAWRKPISPSTATRTARTKRREWQLTRKSESACFLPITLQPIRLPRPHGE